MCGIAGAFSERPTELAALQGALNRIRHRGPDDEGVFVDGPLSMGMRRLSIIDLESGKQPITNEDGSVVVVFNGEIYNHVELRRELEQRGHRFRTHADTEVLVHLYEDEGPRLFERLRGMFAVALWDKRQRRLLLGRDRFGKKPLYVYETKEGGVLFASELKALLPLMTAHGVEASIRPQAIYDYLSLGVVPQPTTIYEGVTVLEPATHAGYELGKPRRSARYWTLQRTPKQDISFQDACERTRELVADAVKIRLRSDVPLGVFLSGGVDSSVVAYEAAKVLGGDLQTFTVAMDDAALDESAVAQRTAKFLGVQNEVLDLRIQPRDALEEVVRHYDQPFADSSAIPSLAVAKLAAEHVKVVLNGDGGDEVFAGYRRHLAALSASVPGLRYLPIGPGRIHHGRNPLGFAARTIRGLRAETWGERYLTWTTDMLKEADKRPIWVGGNTTQTEHQVAARLAGPSSSPLDTLLEGDVTVALQSDLLVKMDMATMAASLEARSPFLDHSLVEQAARFGTHLTLRRGTTKAVLRAAYEARLPIEVTRAKKRGFEIPLEQWLRSDWRQLSSDVLLASGSRLRDFVDQKFVVDLLSGTAGIGLNQKYIHYSLLVLELWLRQEDKSGHRTPVLPRSMRC